MLHAPFFAVAAVLSALAMSASLAIAAEPPAAAAPAGASPDAGGADAGELLFNNACRTCHSVKPGDNRLGPSLGGIVGKKAGLSEGYSYSPSLKSSGVTFDEKTLDAFIANPDAVVPGNNMKPYTGMTSAEDRATIVNYLKTAK